MWVKLKQKMHIRMRLKRELYSLKDKQKKRKKENIPN